MLGVPEALELSFYHDPYFRAECLGFFHGVGSQHYSRLFSLFRDP